MSTRNVDGLSAARGILVGLLLSVAMWGVLAYGAYLLLR